VTCVRINKFLKSESNVTRCSPDWTTAAANQASGTSLAASGPIDAELSQNRHQGQAFAMDAIGDDFFQPRVGRTVMRMVAAGGRDRHVDVSRHLLRRSAWLCC